MPSRPLLLVQLLLLLGWSLSGCNHAQPMPGKLTVGVVSYDAGARSVDKYGRFQEYLAQQTNNIVELEPAFNELKAVEQVHNKAWSIVFAPPGLAAIAILISCTYRDKP